MKEFKKFNAVSLVFIVAFVIHASAIMGLSHGLEAESVEDARIVEGKDYNLTNTSEDYESPSSGFEEQVENATGHEVPGSDAEADSGRAEAIANETVRQAMGFASGISVWTYHNKAWLPVEIIAAGFEAISWLLTAGYFAYCLMLFRRVFRRVRR